MRKVEHLLIGGGIASASAAQELGQRGATSVLLVGRELDPPYERPPATKEYLRGECDRQSAEIARRLAAYRQGHPAVDLEGMTVIVVDDGIATGATVLAALRSLRPSRPERVVLAVPVAPADTLDRLASEADEVVCLSTPEPFYAVGQFYHHFEQTSDEEVSDLLDRARGERL